jgi:hypothetical protein
VNAALAAFYYHTIDRGLTALSTAVDIDIHCHSLTTDPIMDREMNE